MRRSCCRSSAWTRQIPVPEEGWLSPTTIPATFAPGVLPRQPRELLKAAPGVELREMEGADKCCGLGGTFNVYHYDTSMKINAPKAAAIMQTAADAVVTGCPGCMMQLADGLKQQGAKTRVLHTLEVLARAIRSKRLTGNACQTKLPRYGKNRARFFITLKNCAVKHH